MKTKTDTKDRFSARQKNVENLLKQAKHSVTDITIKLGYSDPRSYIRYLRDRGVNVQDEWIQKDDVRYKLYWIPQEQREIKQQDFTNLFEKRYHD